MSLFSTLAINGIMDRYRRSLSVFIEVVKHPLTISNGIAETNKAK